MTSGLPNVNNRGFMAKISDKDEIVDIYLKYQKSLLRLAMTYVDRSYLAEDIVGDTIIAVLERPLEFENEASCACYMRRTVRNKSISLLRRKYQIDLLDDANDIEKRIIELSSSDKSYNDIEVQVLLHEILAEYPKEIREAFIAHILDDETIPSLAAYYGIKNDTLRKQIGRMKTRIAQAIPEKDMKTFLFMYADIIMNIKRGHCYELVKGKKVNSKEALFTRPVPM